MISNQNEKIEKELQESMLQKKIIKPKVVYSVEEVELKKIEVDKNIILRVILANDDTYIDIRKYYKGYPTKKGIRFKRKIYDSIKKIIDDEL